MTSVCSVTLHITHRTEVLIHADMDVSHADLRLALGGLAQASVTAVQKTPGLTSRNVISLTIRQGRTVLGEGTRRNVRPGNLPRVVTTLVERTLAAAATQPAPS